MISPLHTILNIKALYRERHAPEHLKELADMWWRLMLSVGVILFIGAASFSAYELVRARNLLTATHEASTIAPPAIDKSGLESTIVNLEARAGLYSTMVTHLATTTDPSL